MLRPIGNPLPLGFLALAVAALSCSWAGCRRSVALSALLLTAPLQLLACVFGFLARDPVVGTGMGRRRRRVGAGRLRHAHLPARLDGQGLGRRAPGRRARDARPAGAAAVKSVAAAVMGLAAVRFALTGAYQFTASPTWKTIAGITGLLLAAVAYYAALGFELEDAKRKTVLPLLRRGLARTSLQGDVADQLPGFRSSWACDHAEHGV